MSVKVAELSKSQGRISVDFNREAELDRLLSAGSARDREQKKKGVEKREDEIDSEVSGFIMVSVVHFLQYVILRVGWSWII